MSQWLVRAPAARRRMQGVGLVEVLVAMFILAIGVLGAAALQLNALKFNQTAGVRSQATFLAYEIVDRMRANRAQAMAGNYNVTAASTPTCSNSSTVAQQDICDWRTALKQRLPEGKGSVARNVNQFMITIEWSEARNKNEDANMDDAVNKINRFVFITDL